MKTRALGESGLEVSIVGLGAGPLGDPARDEREIDALVGAALELGVTLFDTARSYGVSEARLGRALGARGARAVVATKGGYGVEGVADWTPDAVRRGIDDALRRLRREVLDVFFLHSCDARILESEGLIDALAEAKQAGKVRLAGYSGEGEPLAWAVRSDRFDVIECSVNVLDRDALGGVVREAARRGLGVLAKRPLANAPWRFDAPPDAPDVRTYWERARAMGDALPAGSWAALGVRFAAHAPGVSAALVGTARVEHLRAAVLSAQAGPLPAEDAARLEQAYARCGAGWSGVV